MTQSGMLKKCNVINKYTNMSPGEYIKSTTIPTLRSPQGVAYLNGFQDRAGDMKAWTTYRATNTDMFEEKTYCISTTQNTVLEHGNSSANVDTLHKNEQTEKICNQQNKSVDINKDIRGKVTSNGNKCGNNCNLDGNHGDSISNYIEENNTRSDSNNEVTNDCTDNCVSKSSSPSPVLSECVVEESSVLDSATDSAKKQKQGRRRYYMWGSHKLVKPIKDIPMRFQMLLAESSAARIRCEGQPIYMSHQSESSEIWNDSSQILNTVSCVPRNETEVSENDSHDSVSFDETPVYTNDVHYNEGTNCDLLFSAQSATPVYGLTQYSTSQNIQPLVVYSLPSTSSILAQPQSVPNQTVVPVAISCSAYPPPQTLPTPQMSQITTASYLTPHVSYTLSNNHSQPTTSCGHQKMVQSYHTMNTSEWLALQNNPVKLESSDPHHNSSSNQITSHSVVPPSSNCTSSKYNHQVYAPFPHLSVPPPNFNTPPIIGSFTQAPPITMPPNYNHVLIGVPQDGLSAVNGMQIILLRNHIPFSTNGLPNCLSIVHDSH